MLLAILALFAALGTVLNVFGTLIQVNTIFFTAAAAFLAGVVVVSYGMRAGTLYFFVCLALDFLLNPNKMHVFLYLVLAGYILFAEGSYKLLAGKPDSAGKGTGNVPNRKREWIHRGIRLILFSALYVPVMICLPELFLEGTKWSAWTGSTWFIPVVAAVGIPVWIIYDLAYFSAKKWVMLRFGSLFRIKK